MPRLRRQGQGNGQGKIPQGPGCRPSIRRPACRVSSPQRQNPVRAPALSGISVLLLSTITALGPFIVFLMQMVEGRVAFSGFTLAGLLIYSSGVLLAMPGLIREGVQEAPATNTDPTLTGGKP